MTRKENTEAMYKKYHDLVWYARKGNGINHAVVKAEQMKIENAYPEDVLLLLNDKDNWQHGFNSGMFAALGLMIDKSSKMDEDNICLDT